MLIRNWLVACILLFPLAAMAQQQETKADTAYKPLIPISKAPLLNNVDLIANMRFAFRNEFDKGTYTRSRFENEQFRLEIKGKVLDKLYFRFRDRYTRDPITQSIDNLSRSTDLAFLRFDPNDHWKIYAGKLCADWGGVEFDDNPIQIYEYSDIIENADNFLTGAGVGYVLNKNHEFTFQLLNSRTKTFKELYDSIPGIVESRFPFAGVINWRGHFFNGKVFTIWSYSLFKEATHQYMTYIALGNSLILRNFKLDYDFKYSIENLDRKFIVSNWIPNMKAAQGVAYMSHWLRADVRLNKVVHITATGYVDYAWWNGNPDPNKDKKLRTAWGYIPALEIYPFDKYDLKIFANMVGRIYRYTSYAQTKFGLVNDDTYRFSIGFITPLLVL